MIKLLFVEDDESCAYAVQGGLEMFDIYDIRHASNGRHALEIYDEFCPDVVVSDVEMPIMDGLEFVRAIRAKDKQVVLLLASGHNMPKHVERGYKTGIDEYVKKPYIADELHLRIQAILRRVPLSAKISTEDDRDTKMQRIGSYFFDIESSTLIYEGKISQKLTPRETAILDLLVENTNKLIERSEILRQFWEDNDPIFASRSLDVFVTKLRNYLSEDADITIENVRNRGLKLVVRE